MEYRPPLDGLRALCAAAVFVFHASYGRCAGFLGVDVFFVLSGYLITGILLDDVDRFGRVRYGNFYMRRARRLLPAVFVALLLALVLWPAGSSRSQFPHILPPVLLYYVNWRQAFRHPIEALPHFWSLSVEEQFYLLWPVTVALLARLRRRELALAIAGLAAVFAVARGVLSSAAPPLGYLFGHFSTFARVDELLVGALAAVVHTSLGDRRQRALARAARALAWPSLVALLVYFAFGGPGEGWLLRGGFTAVAVASAFVIVHGASGEPTLLNRLLSARPLVWAGKRSYGIYVFHLPIISAFEPLRTHGASNFIAVTAMRALATVAFAWVSYGLVESRITAARTVRGTNVIALRPGAAG